MLIKDRVAIAGIGQTAFGKLPATELSLDRTVALKLIVSVVAAVMASPFLRGCRTASSAPSAEHAKCLEIMMTRRVGIPTIGVDS